MSSQNHCKCLSTSANSSGSTHGLSSVPALYSSIKGELGLIDPDWSAHPSEWRSLSALWLRVEAALGKTGHNDLSIAEVNGTSLPQSVKDWMLSKKLSQDAHPPDSRFGKIWTDFIAGLPLSEWQEKGSILQEKWCRPGKTGVVMFLLGVYWQAKYSGAGNDWISNVQRIDAVFNLILANPNLYVVPIICLVQI